MKAVAFANNDIAVIAWTFSGKLTNCLGFAIYRIDVKAGTETCLPAMATFPKQEATPGRTTANDPVQKFFWKDVYARRGGVYRYKIVPMTGTPGEALQPMPYGPLLSNVVHLSPDLGALSAYFNRGILATQATAHRLGEGQSVPVMKQKLLTLIADPANPLRKDLAGDMIVALTALPDEAKREGSQLFCALYEFEDVELIGSLAALKGDVNLILANMPGSDKNDPTNDTYATQREEIKQDGAQVTDRFTASGHIGHNKFVVLEKDAPEAVLFGSTNWTSRALCAQTNNSVIARSPRLAKAYLDYWRRLKDDTLAPGPKVTGPQTSGLRDANGQKLPPIELEDGSGTVELWFSPNTPRQRGKQHGDAETCPPDLSEVFDAISKAQQAVLFLAFEPGTPSIVDAIAKAQKALPNLFVRGAVTAPAAANEFYVGINDGGASQPQQKRQKGDPPLPEDFRVVHASGVSAQDQFGLWEKELNAAGFAVVHDKIVVIDPFSDNCVVVTGSHNLGYQASYNNDENLAIIRGHRALAEAYAAHVLDVYDHYAWRWWLQKDPQTAWKSLAVDDTWQDNYFDATNQVKSAELGFWLSASPLADALPTPTDGAASTRLRPNLQQATSGTSPAVGPHSAALRKVAAAAKPASAAKLGKAKPARATTAKKHTGKA
jgi:phosphatidylserine/phosphatidylglycerophosphate/cardiolipin synthase-like enzyme